MLVLAALFIVVNLVVDLLVGAIDPRIADGEASDDAPPAIAGRTVGRAGGPCA